MKDKVMEYDPCDTINLDQSPNLYSHHSNMTLKMKDWKTIHVCTSTSDTKRVTVAIMVNSSGKMHPPMLIFKGVMNEQPTISEFRTYQDCGHCGCQKKAWMDDEMMHRWIYHVLIPWRNTT
jgi:hypothetical protein